MAAVVHCISQVVKHKLQTSGTDASDVWLCTSTPTCVAIATYPGITQ